MSDIFVSYAHINNKPPSGQEDGWVTHFINNLGNELGQRLGRTEHYDLWMDYRLQGNDQVTPEIEQQLRDANILLIMMSKGWLESEWCVKELAYFCEVQQDVSGRIFVIDQDGLPREEKPENLHDLLTYPFYEKTPQDRTRQLGYPTPQAHQQEYFDRIVDLSYQLADAVKKFAAESDIQSLPVLTDLKATVYVAPVHDSLFDQRAKLISELQQFSIQALPAVNRHDSDMDATLAQCSHFIQLLDDNFAMGMPCDQHLTAETAEIPVLQWRDPELDYGKANHEQKALLEGRAVQVCDLADFSRRVRETVLPEPVEKSLVNADKTVFVHASPEDFQRAHKVAQALKGQGYGIALPRYEGDAGRIRKSIERGYQYCDILLVLQQIASADVVEDYLSEAQIYTKKSPAILLCQCQKAEELYFLPAGVKTLPCNGSFETDCLEQFLAVEA